MITALAVSLLAQSFTFTVNMAPKSAPALYSVSINPLGVAVLKPVALDNSTQLGPNNDVVFSRSVPPRSPAYWLQAILPLAVVFGPARSVWCVPGASNARPVATLQYVGWQQGDFGTNTYLALLGIVNSPAPDDRPEFAINVIDATEYTWIPADPITCQGQPSITFWDLTRDRFSVFLFVVIQ